eukprot:GFYU01005267.1.p2 GENE.GFYU01005267.1~~GFYU01005267.1.p2  ORF type:complete len:205 (+),score=53.35 GFYU01005267.1:94-708(+)
MSWKALANALTVVAALVVVVVVAISVHSEDVDFNVKYAEDRPQPEWYQIAHRMLYQVYLTYTCPRRWMLHELVHFDGLDPSYPTLLSFNKRIYDVTRKQEFYGPSGGYKWFSGWDSTRGYLTGDFPNDRSHDISDLMETRAGDVKEWEDFYIKNYRYLGTLFVNEIDPSIVLPNKSGSRSPSPSPSPSRDTVPIRTPEQLKSEL